MTELTKPVKRVTQGTYRVLRIGYPRKIVVTILPGDVLEFREQRGKIRWVLAVDTAFRYAVRLKAEQDRRDKKSKHRSRA